jgi:hypothetical protein
MNRQERFGIPLNEKQKKLARAERYRALVLLLLQKHLPGCSVLIILIDAIIKI